METKDTQEEPLDARFMAPAVSSYPRPLDERLQPRDDIKRAIRITQVFFVALLIPPLLFYARAGVFLFPGHLPFLFASLLGEGYNLGLAGFAFKWGARAIAVAETLLIAAPLRGSRPSSEGWPAIIAFASLGIPICYPVFIPAGIVLTRYLVHLITALGQLVSGEEKRSWNRQGVTLSLWLWATVAILLLDLHLLMLFMLPPT